MLQCEQGGRRDEVLATALQLFSRQGYFNTSVHDIQERASVSIGSIYHHFRNKEGIARALYQRLVDEMAASIEEIMTRHQTAHDRCRAVIACLFELTESAPEAMHYLLSARHREFMPEEKPVCSSRPFLLMKQIVEEGIARGEIRRLNSYVAATSLFGAAIRLVHLRLDQVLPQPPAELLEQVWQCAWQGVAAGKIPEEDSG